MVTKGQLLNRGDSKNNTVTIPNVTNPVDTLLSTGGAFIDGLLVVERSSSVINDNTFTIIDTYKDILNTGL